MFGLSSMYWIMSVVVTFIVIDVWHSQFDPVTRNPPDWLPMFSALLLVNVSVHYKSRSRVIIRASIPELILASDRFRGSDLVYCHRRRRGVAGLGPVF